MTASSLRQVALGLLLLLATSGCATSRLELAPGFDPRAPLRVAVLPFVDRAGGDALVSRPLVAALDLVPILSDDGATRAHAATLLREKVQGNLHRTHLDVVDLHVVDSLLLHRRLDGLALHEGDRAAAARLAADALGADAVVFGEVTEWDREWYLVESVARVGLALELRDGATGGLLYSGEVHDAEASGVSKLPIAYSPDGAAQAVLVQALRGLRNTLFVTLSDDVARAVVLGLGAPAEARASGHAPRVHAVAASAAPGEPLRPEDALVVVALGDPDARATFQVGDGPPVPMTESSPGRYRGALRVSPAHDWRGAPLTVRLVSRELLASTMRAAAGLTTGPGDPQLR